MSSMSVTNTPTARDTVVDKVYFAKVHGVLVINTDAYEGVEQLTHLKKMYNISDEDLEDTICGVMSDGLIQFYSGCSKHQAVMSKLTPREMATILNTHNAFFKHNRFKVYNGTTDSVLIHL